MHCMEFWKGMGAGLLLGTGMGMLLKPKRGSRTAAKLIRAAGDMVDRIGGLFGV